MKKWYILDFQWLNESCLNLLDENINNKANRFIYSVLIEFAIAENDKETAIKHLKYLKQIDRLRENYYQWRINNLLA